MSAERMPFFLARAREWWAVADLLRARVPEGDPVLTVWREAAWCSLLLTKGMYGVAVIQLRKVCHCVAGVDMPAPVSQPRCEADVLAFAADLFVRLRAVVSSRYPFAFASLAA